MAVIGQKRLRFAGRLWRGLQDYVPVQKHLTTPASAAPSDPAEPGPSTQQQQQVGNTRLIFQPSSQKMFVSIKGNYGVIVDTQ